MGMDASVTAAGFEAAQAVADAVLYEGYLLYPYRRSSGKNQVRWQFGVLTPRDWTLARGPVDCSVAGSAESWWQRTECLLEAEDGATLHCRVRFLQVQRRSVEERLPGGAHRPVDALTAGSRSELGFDEAVPREFDLTFSLEELLAEERHVPLRISGGEETEPLPDDRERPAGRVLRTRWPVAVSLTASAAPCDTPARLFRLRLHVENAAGAFPLEATRDEALRVSPIACHTLVAVRDGAFLSLLDPPGWAEDAAQTCANVHTFPVLAGGEDRRDLVLSSPILLYDHPRVAPESPGDLHDATEIDEILSLRTLTLTDAEKREARATDARAAAILDRVEGMPAEVMSRLHGAVRSLRPVPATAAAPPGGERDGSEPPFRPSAPWWEPGADASVSPETDSVVVAGTPVSKGSRVRLRPRRHGTDPQDMFLEGRTAVVEAVLLDVDGAHHLAVTLEDDPAADVNRWYGRFRYFSPDEVEPLPGEGGPGERGE
ncbi:hypothetical protein GCM10023085_16910 [Actinomadura viridis]|uniref:Uncharacterized protein n=2 Tax=Actinomadura viridis TaxID=58110 RepID=A0A931DJ68_9ACTN|nr:hypothetical protein [Actinomadura viridis]MBG6089548.1 hypothetical protein [Actinomadura viridis]